MLVLGFGLRLQSTLAGGGVALTNNGFVNISQTVSAVELVGNGGAVTYIGNGPITNNSDIALEINNTGAGTVTATINNNVTSNAAQAVEIQCGTGLLTLTQNAGSFITANAIANAITLQSTSGGDIVANIHGTVISSNLGAMLRLHQHRRHYLQLHRDHHCGLRMGSIALPPKAAVTYNSSGNINAVNGNALELEGLGAGLRTVNVTGGVLHAGDAGIEAAAFGNGGVLVNMTGGQIGSAAQRAGSGIFTLSAGATANIDVTATDIFSDGIAIAGLITLASSGNINITANGTADSASNAGIDARIQNVGSTGNINVTINGMINAPAGNGVQADNDGSGATNVINNGVISGIVGIESLSVAANVFTAGTVTGTSGTAIDLGTGADTLTIAPTSVINGNVGGAGGTDTLQLGSAGTGNFNVSAIGPAAQYQNFEVFNVVSGTWILNGNGQVWNVIGGTLGGSATLARPQCPQPAARWRRARSADILVRPGQRHVQRRRDVRRRDRRHQSRRGRARPTRRQRHGRARGSTHRARPSAASIRRPAALSPSSTTMALMQ